MTDYLPAGYGLEHTDDPTHPWTLRVADAEAVGYETWADAIGIGVIGLGPRTQNPSRAQRWRDVLQSACRDRALACQILRETLAVRGWSQREAARILGQPRRSFEDWCRDRSPTPYAVVRLALVEP